MGSAAGGREKDIYIYSAVPSWEGGWTRNIYYYWETRIRKIWAVIMTSYWNTAGEFGEGSVGRRGARRFIRDAYIDIWGSQHSANRFSPVPY